MRFDRASGASTELTTGFDLQVEDFAISPDSKTIFFTALQRGHAPIFTVPIQPTSSLRGASSVKTVINEGYNSDLKISPDGKSLILLSSSFQSPAEIHRANSDGSKLSGSAVAKLTEVNATARGRALELDLRKAEETEWKGALSRTIHGFIIRPSNYDATKKYPLLVIIHGGPQSAFNDSWGYRWNPQVFANAGYIVFLPNPRGSVGYGQKFVNEVSADWGGKAYTDIMNGVAHVLDANPNIDRSRIGGTGASYGGYMVDWILGHNNDPRFKFAVLHSHAGVYNLESMAGATEELWFVDWEFKGMPWENPAMYSRWSPHRFARNFSTPTLVTHGELDYRVPIGEGLQLYTALQRRGVESKLIYFPDEGHWILKPQNSVFWYKQVLGWFQKHLNP
jgi:dipeptidyl aminopeptidase/acylaminoacyl peptidase